MAHLQQLLGDVANLKLSYARARDELGQALKQQPEDAAICGRFASVYAGLEDGPLAMKYAERAINLKPTSQDAWGRPGNEETRARVAARFGQKDLAISTLEHLMKIRC